MLFNIAQNRNISRKGRETFAPLKDYMSEKRKISGKIN